MKRIDAGVAMSLGAGIGAAVGVAFDNIAIGVAIGAALGAVFGGVIQKMSTDKPQNSRSEESKRTEE